MNPFVAKLAHGADLTTADRALLDGLMQETADVPDHYDLISEGEVPANAHVVLTGFACRYKSLPDGRRQIVAWLAPGDFCDLHVSLLGEMDHSIATLVPTRVGRLPRDGLEEITNRHPAIARAFFWSTLVDEAILREWLVNNGRRPADVRIAHLICETLVRLRAVGLAKGGVIDFPPTQIDLADTVGLSAVHVNRVVQQLREAGLIAWRGRRLEVMHVRELEAFAEFNPNYLHLRRAGGDHIPG